MLNFEGRILNEYPKVVSQGQQKMKKIMMIHETQPIDVPGHK